MSTLIFGLTVTAIGIVIVFAGLIILIGLIKLLIMATGNMGKKKETAVQPAPVEETAAAEPDADEVTDDDALIAVITAAVACMMDEGSAFTVRRVRRINNAPAWQKAGREEQIYSRI